MFMTSQVNLSTEIRVLLQDKHIGKPYLMIWSNTYHISHANSVCCLVGSKIGRSAIVPIRVDLDLK